VLVPLTTYVALVSLTSDLPMRDLTQIASALQKQVTRDFSQFWDIPATVDAFEDLATMPTDYHPVVVFGAANELAQQLEAAIGPQRATYLRNLFNRDLLQGLHLNAFTRQPFSLVEASEGVSVTLSHEVLEMVADPYGNRLIGAAHPLERDRRVNYLLEICDPCLATWYPVNGIPVSDFYTPRYFDPVRTDGTRYSFTGEIERPLELLEGGYISWIDPLDSGLHQLQEGAPESFLLADVEELSRSSVPLREIVDADPRTPSVADAVLRPARSAEAAVGIFGGLREASRGNALRTLEAVYSLSGGV
jgi:hypothetical protein